MEFNFIFISLIILLGLFALGELFSFLLIFLVNKEMNKRKQKGFVLSRDENPKIPKDKFEIFYEHGYDPDLGWVRKPNTSKVEAGKTQPITYRINDRGARCNPSHENLKPLISIYGDSFSFCRQVEDNETWPWFLSKMTQTNVQNFGVGNYGIDQALLRMKREYPKNQTNVVILGVVPMNIARIANVWTHYREPGNIFGFKPRFILENGSLKLIKNIINTREKFFELEKYLPEIQQHDFLYENFFKKQIIHFPLFWRLISVYHKDFPLALSFITQRLLNLLHIRDTSARALTSHLNLKRKIRKYLFYFDNKELINLFLEILKEFIAFSNTQNFTPIFVLLPRLQDLLFIKKSSNFFYKPLLESIPKELLFFDLSKILLTKENVKDLFVSDWYGGHYSKEGNELVAQAIFDFLDSHLSHPIKPT